MEKAWAEGTRDGRDIDCNTLESTRVEALFTPELLKAAAGDPDEASNAAENPAVRARVEFYRKGLRYTELTMDTVRAAKAAMGTEGKRRLTSSAVAAWSTAGHKEVTR